MPHRFRDKHVQANIDPKGCAEVMRDGTGSPSGAPCSAVGTDGTSAKERSITVDRGSYVIHLLCQAEFSYVGPSDGVSHSRECLRPPSIPRLMQGHSEEFACPSETVQSLNQRPPGRSQAPELRDCDGQVSIPIDVQSDW